MGIGLTIYYICIGTLVLVLSYGVGKMINEQVNIKNEIDNGIRTKETDWR